MSRNRKDIQFHSMRSPHQLNFLRLFVLTLGVAIATFPAPASAKAKHYLLGNPADVNSPLSGRVYDLGGGGTDVDDAIQWMINQVRGCRNCATKLDVVVLRSADSDPTNGNAYNQPIMKMHRVISRDALQDPYADISFTTDLFSWDSLKGTLIDTHFDVDDRLGRLMAFMARQIRDGVADDVLGIGLPEATSLIVDQNGLAQVMGKGPVYFIFGNHQPEVCEPGQPLSFSNFKIWEVKSGQTFNLKNRPSSSYYQRSVDRGQLSTLR